MRDISGKKYISEMRVQGDYLHAYPSTRTQATLPSPQTRTASSVFSKTTRVLEEATKIQTTNAIKKAKTNHNDKQTCGIFHISLLWPTVARTALSQANAQRADDPWPW